MWSIFFPSLFVLHFSIQNLAGLASSRNLFTFARSSFCSLSSNAASDFMKSVKSFFGLPLKSLDLVRLSGSHAVLMSICSKASFFPASKPVGSRSGTLITSNAYLKSIAICASVISAVSELNQTTVSPVEAILRESLSPEQMTIRSNFFTLTGTDSSLLS